SLFQTKNSPNPRIFKSPLTYADLPEAVQQFALHVMSQCIDRVTRSDFGWACLWEKQINDGPLKEFTDCMSIGNFGSLLASHGVPTRVNDDHTVSLVRTLKELTKTMSANSTVMATAMGADWETFAAEEFPNAVDHCVYLMNEENKREILIALYAAIAIVGAILLGILCKCAVVPRSKEWIKKQPSLVQAKPPSAPLLTNVHPQPYGAEDSSL
ncbi:MAG: hypothetical protein V4591_11930, partial [Bdellovibrionota bacterium]